MSRVISLDDPAAIAAATHPARAALLAVMRRPTTAAAAARATGQSRQNAAYHVRALEKAGLLRHAGERQNGNFREQLYVAVAPVLVIFFCSTWSAGDGRASALADQLSLGTLVAHGEQLQRDAAALLDRAAFDGEAIPSASASTEVRFACEADRAAFLRGYVQALTDLTARYGSADGEPYRLVLAAYPDPEDRP
ncbi:MAG TPA: helix-turn-helix domain-containing protein [Acidimicrobiales bacterium]|nr:helix-turn-helix domain-containing protein [Acidimicrobiales bacterium]